MIRLRRDNIPTKAWVVLHFAGYTVGERETIEEHVAERTISVYQVRIILYIGVNGKHDSDI